MNEPYYTIKEAAEKVGVETHVLRYWEEELKMEIHRNQMGHRYYTEHDVELLCMVRKLKDKGMQLKAIRSYIDKRCAESKNELIPVKTSSGIMSNEEKLAQFQRVMNRILSNAIKENNELIGRSAGAHAADSIATKLQSMTKEQEERQEERFRKLDQTLREIQLARKEAAATRPIDKRRQQRLKRKNKQQLTESISEEEKEVIVTEKK